MPLQEEYLDNLLKGITGEAGGDTKEEEIMPEINSMADIESMMAQAVDEVMGTMMEQPIDEVMEDMTEQPTDELSEGMAEQPKDELPESMTEQPTDELPEGMAEQPTDEVVEDMTEPIDELIEVMTDTVADEALETVSEQAADEALETVTENADEEEWEFLSEKVTDEPGESIPQSEGSFSMENQEMKDEDIFGDIEADLDKLLQEDDIAQADTAADEAFTSDTVQSDMAAGEVFINDTVQADAADEMFINDTVQADAADEMFINDTVQADAADEMFISDAVQADTVVDDIFKAAVEDEAMEDEVSREVTPEDTLTVEETSGLSEKDIEQLLMAGQSASEPEPDAGDVSDDDLMRLLEDTPDTELNQIHDILQKADNNEAVDESVLSAGEKDGEVFDPLAEEGSSSEELSEKERKAQEKKRLKEEKKAEKARKREEKKALSAAKKEEKKAFRTLKKGDSSTEENPTEQKEDEIMDEEDFSVLDNIIGSAEDYPSVESLGLGENSQTSETGETAADDVIDMESLFSMDGTDDDNILGLLQFAESLGEDSDFPLGDAADTDVTTAGEKQAEDGGTPPKEVKKKGFFARVMDFLTEEDEEETDGNAEIQLSDENKNILNELDKEKGKKGKKKKGKKGKKGEEAATAEGEEGEGTEDGGKGGKKKEKKPKKEKMPKKVREPMDPDGFLGKKLSFKKILPVLLICAALGVAIFVMTNLAGDYTVKKAGREAYYNGDYQTCYENLFGKNLNESEQVMYSKSESILCIRLWFREYELFVEEGLELQALDSLLQSVEDYPKLYDYASRWNAGTEVSQTYQQILDTLSVKYQLSEAQAKELMAVEDDREYTRRVNMIVQGKGYGAWDKPAETEEPPVDDVLEDMLLEEEDLGDVNFIDNN